MPPININWFNGFVLVLLSFYFILKLIKHRSDCDMCCKITTIRAFQRISKTFELVHLLHARRVEHRYVPIKDTR